LDSETDFWAGTTWYRALAQVRRRPHWYASIIMALMIVDVMNSLTDAQPENLTLIEDLAEQLRLSITGSGKSASLAVARPSAV
jgi:hypothetical protein